MSPSRPRWFKMSVAAIHRVGALKGRHASKIAKGTNPHGAVLLFDARLASPDSQRRTATVAGATATADNTRSSRTRHSSRNSFRFYQSSSGRKLPVGAEVLSGHESSQTAPRG